MVRVGNPDRGVLEGVQRLGFVGNKVLAKSHHAEGSR